jgi:hypothetical protein
MINRILLILNTIPVDKLLHFFVGFVLSVILIPFFNWIGLLAVVLIAALKEVVYDKYLGKGKFEIADFIWTIVPAIIVLIIKHL